MKLLKGINRLFFLLITIIMLFSSCKAILMKHVINGYNKNNGIAFPNLVLQNEEGKMISMDSLKGNVIYVDLWGTWCAACIQEMPYLNKMKENLKNYKDISYVQICTKSETEAWKNMVKEKKMSGINVILINDSDYNQLEKLFKINEYGYPYSFIIDKKGMVLGSIISSDQPILAEYALIEAREGIDPKTATYKFIRLGKKIKNLDDPKIVNDPEAKEFVSFIEEFSKKQ